MSVSSSQQLQEHEKLHTLARATHPYFKIFAFVGASGAGKTTIIDRLRQQDPKFKLVESVTTRAPRETDRPGEYRNVSPKEFEEMQKADEFIWTTEYNGNLYGTTKQSVNDALKAKYPSLIHVVPERLITLRQYTSKAMPIFISVSDETVLRERLKKRDPGQPETYYNERVESCRNWKTEMKLCGFPYATIDNNCQSIEKFEEIVMESVIFNMKYPPQDILDLVF